MTTKSMEFNARAAEGCYSVFSVLLFGTLACVTWMVYADHGRTAALVTAVIFTIFMLIGCVLSFWTFFRSPEKLICPSCGSSSVTKAPDEITAAEYPSQPELAGLANKLYQVEHCLCSNCGKQFWREAPR